VGDAAFFVDPIFSSGIGDAMHSAKFASEAITEALAAGDSNASSFQPYEQKMRIGLTVWQDWVRLFYETSSIFSRVIAESESRASALRICEGEVYDEAAYEAVIQLREIFRSIEAETTHPLNRILQQATML